MREAYPGGSPSIRLMLGRGEFWVTKGVITFDGEPMRTVTAMELRDGKVAHQTIYSGEPWEPPAWRAVSQGSRGHDRRPGGQSAQ